VSTISFFACACIHTHTYTRARLHTLSHEKKTCAHAHAHTQVKCWNAVRGFGFILRTSELDLFCHVNDITDGDALREGVVVEYKEQTDLLSARLRAVCVTGGHWKYGHDAHPTVRKRNWTEFSPPQESPHQYESPASGWEGFWVLAENFEGLKSFGRYMCDNQNCRNAWLSAHVFPRYRQGCQMCENEIFPCCLWYNTPPTV